MRKAQKDPGTSQGPERLETKPDAVVANFLDGPLGRGKIGSERCHCGQLADGAPWMLDVVETPVGKLARVATTLSRSDRIGAILARCGAGRMRYSVEPGLYAAGSPGPDSPVLVSANYKMSFDYLRRELAGLDAWILVLDTKGINVWCAAGKGTFGTEELARRIEETRLAEAVSHRTVIVPQLGAPGVAAHEVKKQSGFRVVYGPVRAADIPRFLAAGMKATPEMRLVHFRLRDRAVVIPVEVVGWSKYLLVVAVVILLLSGLGSGGYSFSRVMALGPLTFVLLLAGFLAGTIAVPLLLPWLPGRAFSTKGAVVGVVLAALATATGLVPVVDARGVFEASAWLLLLSATVAFLALNFTGSTTFTSLSGVRREMRVAIPAEIAAGVVGLGLLVATRFF